MATTPKKALDRDIKELRGDIAALADSVNELAAGAGEAKDAMGKGGERAATAAKGAIKEIGKDAKKAAAHGGDAATDMAESAMEPVVTTIKNRPLTAVLSALGLGFVIGMLRRK
jgi:ElaB/YqjD/DUF883 family membrane-anchored ribosome-binding protein